MSKNLFAAIPVLALSAIYSLLGICSQAKASSLPVPFNIPVEQIQICLNAVPVPCQFGTPPTPPSFSALGGTGAISLTPSPNLTASASVTGVNQQLEAQVLLDYYFEVSGAATSQVPVVISVSSTLMPPNAGAGFANSAILEFGLANFASVLERACAPVVSGCVGTLTPKQETVTTNTIYEIDMLLGAAASTFGSGTTDSVTDSMDPVIYFLNPSDASQFQLLFSDGVGNSPASAATPLPAALPLFATGLGALGLLGWRRKRKAQAIAA